MEVVGRGGPGRLADLIGASGREMDREVRRVTEGPAALQSELNKLPPDARMRLQRFVDGINASVDQVQANPAQEPAEFTLLNDQPIQHFSVADIIAFGEYAGRFFGEFGHGELGAAATYEHLVARFGRSKAEKVFHDLLPLNDSRAPTSISARDGRFPRHTKGHVKSSYRGSKYANHNPAVLPPISQLAPTAAAVDAGQADLAELQPRPSTPRPLLGGAPPTPCPVPAETVDVSRTLHGPGIAGPDKGHHLYVRESVVDHRLLRSLVAWDTAGRRSTVHSFGAALSGMSLGFNFFYAGDDGHLGYWHTGAYPLRPKNADPTLPMPGDGRYDWRGLERWRAHPHVIDPRSGYLVNWNNKPSVGWWSKNLATGGEGGIWGPEWESVPLAASVRRRSPLTFASLGQVPRDVAFI